MTTPTPANARQRAHLEARRRHLITRADVLRERGLELWRRAHRVRNEGGDSLHLDRLALDTEEACYRVSRALLAIDDELGEGEDG